MELFEGSRVSIWLKAQMLVFHSNCSDLSSAAFECVTWQNAYFVCRMWGHPQHLPPRFMEGRSEIRHKKHVVWHLAHSKGSVKMS